MRLEDARDLKRRIREAAPAVAAGIRLTSRRRDYRVVVVVGSAERNLLRDRRVRALFASRSCEVGIDVLTETRAVSGPGLRTTEPAPLRIGASIGHIGGGSGSLGFFAVRRLDGVHGLVSCN